MVILSAAPVQDGDGIQQKLKSLQDQLAALQKQLAAPAISEKDVRLLIISLFVFFVCAFAVKLPSV